MINTILFPTPFCRVYVYYELKGEKKCTEPFCSIWVGRKVYYAEYILYSKRSPMGEGLLYSKYSGTTYPGGWSAMDGRMFAK
jgi:hypothetical protein